MTTKRDFAAQLFKEHFINGSNQIGKNWGHNYNSLYKKRKGDDEYIAICLILEYFKPGPNNRNVDIMIKWLEDDNFGIPFLAGENKSLLWNLYYALRD